MSSSKSKYDMEIVLKELYIISRSVLDQGWKQNHESVKNAINAIEQLQRERDGLKLEVDRLLVYKMGFATPIEEIQAKAVEDAMAYADGDGHEMPYRLAVSCYAATIRAKEG